MVFILSSVDRSYLPENGGYKLTLNGSFDLGHNYRAHVGIEQNEDDPICHSGIAGQGSVLNTEDGVTLVCYTPIVPVETLLSVFAVDVDTLANRLLADVMTSTHRQFAAKVFALRKVFPPFYKVGPRKLLEAPITP